MVCSKCGTQIKDGIKFCPKCGAKQEQPAAPDSTLAANVQSPVGAASVESSPAKSSAQSKRMSASATAELSDAAAELKEIWPDWTIVEKLGQGSFGRVYKAKKDEFGTALYSAIKIIKIPRDSAEADVLRSEAGMDDMSATSYYKGVVDECVNEINLMASLKGNANIVSVEDYKVVPKTDEIGWNIYIRMELLTSFVDYSRNRTLSEQEVARLGADICNALEYCNKQNIMHRDIKPENIFVSPSGSFKLGDFGIARKLEKASVGLSQKGTYNYMAPEIFNGNGNYDFRADIYSLGVVLYKLLNNNRLPLIDTAQSGVSAQQMQDALDRRMKGETLPAPCNASPQMTNIVLTACAYQPQGRFASAAALKKALSCVSGSGVSAQPLPTAAADATAYTVRAQQSGGIAETVKNNAVFKKVSGAVDSVKAMPKPKLIGIGVVALLAVALVVGGIIFLSWYTGIDQKILRALEKGDYDAAVALVSDEKYDHDDDDAIIDMLTSRMTELKDGFSGGEIEYAVAKMEMTAIKNISDKLGDADIAKDVADAQTFLREVNESKTAFSTAEAFFANGDYGNAIINYEKVIDADCNFEAAKTQLAAAIDKYRESTLATAADFAANEEYAKAINALNSALLIIPDDAQLTQQLAVYSAANVTKLKNDALNTAAEFAANSDFVNAINTITAAQVGENASDPDLQAAYNSYAASYTQSVTNAVNGIMDTDYNEALKKVETALAFLPDNSDLKALYERVLAAAPVKFKDVKFTNSDRWTQFTENGVEDSLGNLYSPGNLFMLSAHGGYNAYAEFYVGGNYKKMTGRLATYDGSADSEARLEVYAGNSTEDMKIIESYIFSRTTTPTDVVIDISGYQWIRIQLVKTGENYYYDDVKVLLSEFEIR